MADLPLSFSGPMVRALLAGTKTQTRRSAPEPSFPADGCNNANMGGRNNWFDYWATDQTGTHRFKTKYAVGDRLYVREHWRTTSVLDLIPPRDLLASENEIVDYTPIRYEADGATRDFHPHCDPDFGKFRQAMHMPKWASRITLIVTDVRIERLQDCSREDAIAEGLVRMPIAPTTAIQMGCDWGFEGDSRHGSPVSAYAALWDHINGPGAWAANPWIVAYTFRRIMGNIDQIEREAA